MRACSRCVAGSPSAKGEAFGTGSDTRRLSEVVRHPARSSDPRTATIAVARFAIAVSTPPMPPYSQSLSIGEFNLFRNRDFDHRTTALFDPTANTDRMTLQSFWIDAGRSKFPPMTLENGDSEVLRPAPPEIQVYCGAAFPHRQDLAFHQCKLPPRGSNPVNIFGTQRGEIGVGPKSAT